MAKKENNKKNYQRREEWIKLKRAGRYLQIWTGLGWAKVLPGSVEHFKRMEAR